MASSRRSFIRGGAAAIVYKFVESGPYLKAAGPNDQISLGHIGVGIQGTGLLQGFKAIPGVRITAMADVYDGHLARAKELTDGQAVTTRNYEEVLNRKDIDAVVIATPDHWHRHMVLDALAAGKDVYCEKPMTWSVEQGKDIIAAVKKSGKILQVGSQGKTAASTAKARELVKSGALGKVNMVRMTNNRNSAEGAWQYPVPPDASPQTIDWNKFIGPSPVKRAFDPKIFFRWRCWWEYSGGVATDLFVHLLTTLHEIMDVPAPKSVASQGGLYKWKDGRTVPDLMESVFEYEGFMADMYVNLANARAPHPPTIMGTDGTLVMGFNKLTLYPEPPESPAQRYPIRSWPEAMQKQYYESIGFTAEGRPKEPPPPVRKEQEITVDRGPSHQEYFILSLRDRSPSREDAVAGHYAASAAHLANMSYRRGRRVAWDYKTGKIES